MPEVRKGRAPAAAPARWTTPYDGSTYPLALAADGSPTTGFPPKIFGVMAVFVALASYFVVVPLVNLVVLRAGFAVEGGESVTEYVRAGQAFETVIGLVGAHLGLASLILVVLAMLAFLHRRRPAWLWSVMPGVRWRYGLACLIVAAVVFTLVLLVRGVPAWHPQPGAVAFLVAIVLTSPLQAAAEEVFFRGYILQAMGLIVRHDWFPIVASALLFALFHGTQNPALFVDRLAFGVLAGILVRVTGGLEAGIAAHIVNNLFAFALAALTSSVAEVRAIQEVTWVAAVFDVVGFALVAAGCWWVARRMRVPDRV